MCSHRIRLCSLANIYIVMAGMACICCFCLSCVSRAQLNLPQEAATRAPIAFPGLPQLARLASATGDFLPYRDGADFAADLAFSRCAPSGTAAVFSPQYVAPSRSLPDAAYCLYRLELDPVQTSATLSIVWNGSAPAAADCWVGLSAWQRGRWDWQPLSGATIELSDPSQYGDSAKRCYVALVILGTTPVELASISYGPLPPPPGRGYTLFAPMAETTTYLIDEAGVVVHTWTGEHMPGASVRLAENGHLWRQVQIYNPEFLNGGKGGRLEELDWDGNPVWTYDLSTDTLCTHHDFDLMPNGNVLLTVWNKYTREQAIAAGRDPATMQSDGLLIDAIFEVAPVQPEPEIVWQWFAFDHLVQDFDSAQANYGDPAAHPELIDLNYYTILSNDWTHINSIDYNATLDQIVINPLCLSEFWIVDHSTTTAEAAGHTGGTYGRGGDLLYRWGNPEAYGAGGPADMQLFGQHDVHWLAAGLPGAGDLLIFNNMAGNLVHSPFSSVMEITAPMNPDGSYYMSGGVYGPDAPVWEYKADPPEKFFGVNMSSAQRLADGNTLICIGPTGKFIEVTPSGEVVWEYQNQFPTPDNSAVFRALRYPEDYPGLAGLP